ncbi:AHH domain-containing protein [Candidatus Nomurabacteria bacterium]|nr:AHH domain-containing protein [Candidatus Nomurabacteria bacterium]
MGLGEDGPATPLNELEITQESHYYPFGMKHLGPWYETVAPENKYLYNGIERNEDNAVNLDLAIFRSYDPAIGRWLQIDPLAEIATSWSPYRFGFDNPSRFSDPWGLFENRGEARRYRREMKRDAKKNGEEYNGAKIVRNEDGRYDLRFRGSDGYVTRKESGKLEYGVVSTGPTTYSRPPELGSWEADMYTSVLTEDNKYIWIYRGSGTQYVSPINAAEGIGRHFAGVGMLKVPGFRVHHLASNKNSRYTHLFDQIAKKYGLSLNGKWNKMRVSSKYHYSKHPTQYHDFVLDAMKAADVAADGDPAKFIKAFQSTVKGAIEANPNILNKTGW